MAETVVADPAAAPAATPNPETHDPVTGKSWKELAKEHERKSTESQAEISKLRSAPPDRPDQGRATTRAEYIENMRQKFIEDPVEAIIEIATTATHVGITRTRADIAKASRVLKEVKKDLKGRYEDFAEYQEEFETRLEDAPIERMTKEGLEMVFHAIRGEKLDAKLKELKAKAAKEDPAAKIVGPTSPAGSGAPAGPHGAKALTDRQQAEMDRLGLEETTYRKNLQTRRENAKRLGVPDDKLPETMGEPLNRKTT